MLCEELAIDTGRMARGSAYIDAIEKVKLYGKAPRASIVRDKMLMLSKSVQHNSLKTCVSLGI